MKEYAKGILQKNEKTFFIVCKVSGKHCYCSLERLNILAKKYGGLDKIQDNYISRDAKRLLKTGTTEKAIGKLGAKAVVAESKLIHKDIKEKKEYRKITREERLAKRAKVPHDAFIETLTAAEIEERTSITDEFGDVVPGGRCINLKYRLDWCRCNRCKYVDHCRSDIRVLSYDINHDEISKIRDLLKQCPTTAVRIIKVASGTKKALHA